MLMDRIIGAFTFRKGIYAEVESDTSFTSTAWILVAVVAFLKQLGAQASSEMGVWLLGAVVSTIFAIAGFAVACMVINVVGRALFKAEVTFDEVVRTLGLAYVWNVVGVISVLSAFAPALACLLGPVMVITSILMVVAWFIAAKEALDLDWVQTIVTVIGGWLALTVVMVISGLVLGMLGLGAVSLLSLLG